ncbi:unnamed protein product [Parnassius apollo]|uniref:(apollo) hypothetical protein n=1 Tax=Parnassius apollo TaxID=110799 RepID=A0A8S3W4S3_PARAO|nr:unnamed protein product [Parnassius apollo]
MKNLIVLLCAISCAYATVSDQQASIVRSDFHHDSEGEGYQFSFETDNGIAAQADGKLTVLGPNSTAHQVQGSVSYTSPEGQKIVTTYVADESGYHPTGDHLPAPMPIPEYIARAIEYIAAHPYKEETEIQDDSGDMHGILQQSVSKIVHNVGKALAKKAYVNRKGYYSIKVQVVCDSNLKIRDIVARWRGRAHDSRVFNESTIKERFERGNFHGRLLGDSGYACTAYLFTSLPNPSNDKEEAYNRAHVRTRNTVERCFGLWKQRFRCPLRGIFMKLSTAKTTIVALAVLHNIAIV